MTNHKFHSAQNHLSEPIESDTDPLQDKLLLARREALHWKTLAQERQDQINAIKQSPEWRYGALLRILPEVKQRWKELALLGVVAVVSIPLWPFIFVLMLFKSGRDLMWQGLQKAGPLGQLLMDIRARLLPPATHTGSAAGLQTPLRMVLTRPTEDRTLQSPADLLQQLCPQQRALLAKAGWKTNLLVNESDNIEMASLSKAETYMLQLYFHVLGETQRK